MRTVLLILYSHALLYIIYMILLERKKALLEIVRILRPGAKICIIDIQHINEYIKVFKENGITDINKFKAN